MKTYISLCTLNTMDKLFKQLTEEKIRKYIEMKFFLPDCEQQYVIRKGRSTANALEMVQKIIKK